MSNKENIKRLEFVMNTKKDRKIISWLETKKNKSHYIKLLIKKDMWLHNF